MYQHTLIIGGTGMLSAASVQLATQSVILTSVARTRRSLAVVGELISATTAIHYMLALDWAEPDRFLRSTLEHLSQTTQPDLVVVWIHDEALAMRLAAAFDVSEHPCRFFHVVGSATSDPSQLAATFREPSSRLKVAYHQVILGYVIEGGIARWLANDEISAGVIDAIARSQREYIVGTVRPWSMRP